MKKTYITPAVSLIEMADEAGIICTSVPVANQNPKDNITFQSINRPGVWDSSNWTEMHDLQNGEEDK